MSWEAARRPFAFVLLLAGWTVANAVAWAELDLRLGDLRDGAWLPVAFAAVLVWIASFGAIGGLARAAMRPAGAWTAMTASLIVAATAWSTASEVDLLQYGLDLGRADWPSGPWWLRALAPPLAGTCLAALGSLGGAARLREAAWLGLALTSAGLAAGTFRWATLGPPDGRWAAHQPVIAVLKPGPPIGATMSWQVDDRVYTHSVGSHPLGPVGPFASLVAWCGGGCGLRWTTKASVDPTSAEAGSAQAWGFDEVPTTVIRHAPVHDVYVAQWGDEVVQVWQRHEDGWLDPLGYSDNLWLRDVADRAAPPTAWLVLAGLGAAFAAWGCARARRSDDPDDREASWCVSIASASVLGAPLAAHLAMAWT